MKITLNRLFCITFLLLYGILKSQSPQSLRPTETITEAMFFTHFQEKLRLNDQSKMVQKTSYTDRMGNRHSRFQQRYKNLKVIGGGYVLHSHHDAVYNSHGALAEDININIVPQISEANAIQNAKINFVLDHITDTIQRVNIQKIPLPCQSELCIVGENYPKKSQNFLLAWEVKIAFTSTMKPLKKVYYVDAITGTILTSLDEMPHINIKGSGKSNYYGTVDFTVDSIAPSTFLLRDSARNIVVFDDTSGDTYSNETKEWNFTSREDKSAIDVMYGTAKFYDFLHERFGLEGIDNAGGPLKAGVNIPTLANAYWDSESAHFGSGDCNNFNPFTAIDVVGHEFTHGLTDHFSNLIYWQESGALNEAMSDIIGKSLEKIYRPNEFSWGIGGFFSKDATDFRNMANPNLTDDPKYYKGKYWEGEFWDNYGVHTNSGVLNHWFYLLVEGGKGTNEAGVQFDVNAIGLEKALDIAVNLNLNYLLENSNYFDAYTFSKDVVKDLYPDDVTVNQALQEAWKAVGLSDDIIMHTKDSLVLATYIFGYNAEPYIKICREELKDLNINFKNASDVTIPSGTEMTVDFVFEYFANDNGAFTFVDDTIHKKEIIAHDISKDSIITFNLSYAPSQSIIFINLNMSIIINFDNEKFAPISKTITVEIGMTEIDSLSYRIGSFNVNFDEYCSADANVSNASLLIFNKSCNFGGTIFDLEISGPDGVETHKLPTTSSRNISNLYLPIPENIINDAHVGNTKDLIIRLYSLVNDNRYLIFTNRLHTHLKDHLSTAKSLTFSNKAESLKYITLTESIFVSNINYNGALTLISDGPFDIEDCYDPELVFDKTIDDILGGHNFIQFCADLRGIKNPMLSFDLKLSSSSPYKAAVKVKQDDEPIHSGLIYNTGNAIKKYTFPLNETDVSNLEMVILLNNANATLDNVKLSGTVPVDELMNGQLQYNNPVDDILGFHWEEHSKSIMQIFNMQGRLVYEANVDGTYTEVKTANFSNGMYVFRYQSENHSGTGKFIVAHR